MIGGLFKGLASLALWAAGAAFITGVTLLLVGSWLATWPLLRMSPRDRRVRAALDLVASGVALAGAFQKSGAGVGTTNPQHDPVLSKPAPGASPEPY